MSDLTNVATFVEALFAEKRGIAKAEYLVRHVVRELARRNASEELANCGTAVQAALVQSWENRVDEALRKSEGK